MSDQPSEMYLDGGDACLDILFAPDVQLSVSANAQRVSWAVKCGERREHGNFKPWPATAAFIERAVASLKSAAEGGLPEPTKGDAK